jgi:hypothetical protein
MKNRKIYDKDIDFSNYGKFKDCRINNGGNEVEFVYVCGDRYVVSLEKLTKWFETPHYLVTHGKARPFNTKIQLGTNYNRIIRVRKVLMGTAVRVYLDNSTAYDVPWDTVLMVCEPRYEHYGGLK